MKIFPIEKIKELDAYTIENEPILSIDLMERAAHKCTQWLLANMPAHHAYVIFCGPGNNGGDGLAIARQLAQKKREVRVYLLRSGHRCSADFETNLQLLQKNPKIRIMEMGEGVLPDQLPSDSILVDALFGSGLNKALNGAAASIIEHLNGQQCFAKVSIDIPSGLFGDDNSSNEGVVFSADITLSLQFPKLAFLFAENADYVGNWHVLPIGLHPRGIAVIETLWQMTDQEEVSSLIRPRHRFSHKGNYGHALLIAGSKGKAGAAILASEACLRAGAGLLTTHIPACAYHAMQSAIPEAMVSSDPEEDAVSALPAIGSYQAIAAGPGMGTREAAAGLLKLLIQEANVPMVLDADALNILGENKTWLAFLRPGTILTPHPKEFDRMAGESVNAFGRWQKQVAFSRKFKVYVLLKGAFTCISTPDGRSCFNASGTPGMATAGSGDVLTGILLGLLAQGYSSLQAALLGTYLHGLAGEIAAQRRSVQGMIAGDILEALGKAWRILGAAK